MRMGPLIGSGGYGRVYRATFNGKQVAIKVGGTTHLPFAMPVSPAAIGQQVASRHCLAAALSNTYFTYQKFPFRVSKSLLCQLPSAFSCPESSCIPLLGSRGGTCSAARAQRCILQGLLRCC